MGSLAKAIEPKSDQLNSDDLITGPITVKVTAVDINESAEQKVVIHYEGDHGKPYKPCKGMTRVMAEIWGGADNGKSFVGQSMTLYRDPRVKWAGVEVGGIRISHMTGIDRDTPVVVTQAKGKRQPTIIHPLVISAPAPTEDKAAAWTDKLIERIQTMATLQDANAALADALVSKRVDQISATRPDLNARIDAALAALPSVTTTPEDPPLDDWPAYAAQLIDELNIATGDEIPEIMERANKIPTPEIAKKVMAAFDRAMKRVAK